MSLSVLLLLVCSTQASDFFSAEQAEFRGTLNYYTKDIDVNGSALVIYRETLNSRHCYPTYSYVCQNSSCGYGSYLVKVVDKETNGEWCQTEHIHTFPVPSNDLYPVGLSGDWTNGIKNSIRSWETDGLMDLRNRSDISKENSSPQTTVLAVLRVSSNCKRDFNLSKFDPDGDEVKCRYGDTSVSECDPCNPPSVLSLSPSCTLSFSPTSSSNEGPYAVQLVMEDFPRQSITLTQTNGTQTTITTNDAISKVPVQFVLMVDPVVPSCTEGLFLPKFLPPTPASGTQLYTSVNKTVEINISAETINSTISELLFSGPYNAIKNKTGPGEFTLKWTPSELQAGGSHALCFVIQALSNGTKYHSDLRCVILSVGDEILNIPAETTTLTSPPTTSLITVSKTATPPAFVAGLRMKISSLVDLSEMDIDAFLNQIKEALVKKGLPQDITLYLRNSEPQIGPTIAPSTAKELTPAKPTP